MHAYLTTEEVAERYRTSPATVRYWRHVGKGPKWIKPGRKALYALEELDRYDAEDGGSRVKSGGQVAR